ncbi:MAG: cob(I)yrinic acid a,c-diamide adenosyltransferase [Rhabdochlamydiaceae bacterium]
MTKIYTRTGDKGMTSLNGGMRVLKSDERVETYGTVDELNSAIGVILAEIGNSKKKRGLNVKNELEQIQRDLFAIGSSLADPSAKQNLHLQKRVEDFEKLIDAMTEKLPFLRNFILPGGSLVGAQLHLARTICRRAERRVVNLSQNETIDDNIRMYLNRLSDLLFTMARFVNQLEKKTEIIWVK